MNKFGLVGAAWIVALAGAGIPGVHAADKSLTTDELVQGIDLAFEQFQAVLGEQALGTIYGYQGVKQGAEAIVKFHYKNGAEKSTLTFHCGFATHPKMTCVKQ